MHSAALSVYTTGTLNRRTLPLVTEITKMERIEYKELLQPTAEIAATINRWENDADLVPFIRPSATKEDLEKKVIVTEDEIQKRLQTHKIYLIYADGELVGELSYQIDPPHCLHRVSGTAWVGIYIGKKAARNRGIGFEAMRFMENAVRIKGLKRIELGVFEFNERARRLYLRLGYEEIGRIEGFTYWNGKMWQDIRMEKYL
jgi:RimJ/RimL family protein N-acetyltransferase